jgi:pyrroline-5-carboxylate reductase
MGGALAGAVCRSKSTPAVGLSDRDAAKAEAIAAMYPNATVTDPHTLARESSFLFLGVKPQVMADAIAEIRDDLARRRDVFVLVTMAAGVTVSAIEAMLGFTAKIVRIMPNTPVSTGEGLILYTANAGVTPDELKVLLLGLAPGGRAVAIPEEKIDAASALSGCGPAYVYLFAEALADGAVECGLPRDKAMLYAAQTLTGAAKLLLESGKHPGTLKDEVCSPGGTTIAGVHALEEGGFRASAMNAVCAAYEKTMKLKK